MTDDTKARLRLRLQYWRIRRAMDIRKLAKEAGVSSTTISRIERDSTYVPQPAVIRRLANALSISVEEMWETENPKLAAATTAA